MRNPADTLYHGLILSFKPVNMDVLPLFILLMLVFPPVLSAMLRQPNLTLAASFLLYLAARHFSWNLPAYPIGSWYFNPFCWQPLFVLGGWFALGGSIKSRPAYPVARAARARECVPRVCAAHDDGGAFPRARPHDAGVAR